MWWSSCEERKRTPKQTGDKSSESDSDAGVRVRVVPALVRVSRPREAHEERGEARDEEEVADPVERLDLLEPGCARFGARRGLRERE